MRFEAPAALEAILGFAAANRIRFTRHARDQMAERGVTRADVRHALLRASQAIWQGDKQNWRVNSFDLASDKLRVILAIEDGDVVVTVF